MSVLGVPSTMENHLKREDDAESVLRQAFIEEFRAQILGLLVGFIEGRFFLREEGSISGGGDQLTVNMLAGVGATYHA